MATILDLLMALNQGDLPGLPKPAPSAPIPYAPVGNLGPLSEETTAAFGALNPEPVPPQIIQPGPADQGFVSQFAGQAPAPPAPLSKLQRIMNAIGGFGAGVQGQGPQYLESLRAPQREYERQRGQFEERRTRGVELAERRAEREAAQENRANELLYESEYKKWLSKNSDRSDEAKTRMAQMFTLQRDANAARLEEERTQRLERRQRQDDARSIAGRLGTGPGAAPPAIAKELGSYYANLTDKLSPAAAKWQNAQAKRAEILAGRAGTGGGGGGGTRVSGQTAKLVAEFNQVRENLVTAAARGDAKGQEQLRMRLNQLVKRLAGRPGVEAGYGAGQWPYVKVHGVLSTGAETQPTAQQGGQKDSLGIR